MAVPVFADMEKTITQLWDLIVVGAGPAGAMCAREAARAGVLAGASVLLVDKAQFPRPKVCGCCLNAAALLTLESVGLGNLTHRLGAQPLNEFFIAAGRKRASLRLPAGAAISREVFDAALVKEAIAAGAHFLPGTRAVLDGIDADGRRLILQNGSNPVPVRARVVIAADGLGGRLLDKEKGFGLEIRSSSRIGASVIIPNAPDFYRPGTIFMACGRRGYLGLVRLEDGRLNMAAALDPEFVKETGGPCPAAAEILKEAGFPPVPDAARLPWSGTPALTRRRLRVAGERFFVIGDAAGYVEPFTGEGMSWALACGVAVAPVALAAQQGWDNSLARRWEDQYRRLIRRHQAACSRLTRLLRRPVLTRLAVGAVAKAPFCAQPIVGAMNAPLR